MDPLVGAVWMTYRRSLRCFRGSCWIRDWCAGTSDGLYRADVYRERRLVAVGWVKALLRDREGNLEPQKVLETVMRGL